MTIIVTMESIEESLRTSLPPFWYFSGETSVLPFDGLSDCISFRALPFIIYHSGSADATVRLA